MPKLPRISGEKAIRIFQHLGFIWIRQRGSHVILKKQTTEGDIGCVIPLHHELAIGTLRGIIRMAKITLEEFTRTYESL